MASTLGILGSVSRKYAHKIPFLVKINHNELLTYPAVHDQTLFASVNQTFDLGAVAIGATVYFGSPESDRQIQEISEAFAHAHDPGPATILWAHLRNSAFKKERKDFHNAADLTGQGNYLGATIEADIIKQKQAEKNGGYPAINFGRTDDRVYRELTSDHPIDLVRYQVANCFMGRVGMINSGGIRQGRLATGGSYSGDQQTRWGNVSHQWQKIFPETNERRLHVVECHSGCLPVQNSDCGLSLRIINLVFPI